MLAQSALMHLPMAFSPAAAEACDAVAANSRAETAQINLDSIMCPPKAIPITEEMYQCDLTTASRSNCAARLVLIALPGPPEAGACCNVLFGSIASFRPRADHFRSAPISGIYRARRHVSKVPTAATVRLTSHHQVRRGAVVDIAARVGMGPPPLCTATGLFLW